MLERRTAALAEATKTIPIVFAQGLDPVGAGYIDSLARPDGNITGFNQLDYSVAGKWMELLREISPEIKRVAVLREPGAAGIWTMGYHSVGGAIHRRGVETHQFRHTLQPWSQRSRGSRVPPMGD